MQLRPFAAVLFCLLTPPSSAQMRENDVGRGKLVAPASPSTPQATSRVAPRNDGSASKAISLLAGSTCLREEKMWINSSPAALHVGLKTYPQTLKLPDRTVVLTFDDGPARETTPAILDALREACVHATFFLIGRHAAALPRLARREMEEGHSTGHHSQTHPWFTLRGFDTASAEHDIETGIANDERAIYGAAATPEHPHVPFFRFPGFADTPELLAFLDKRKVAVFGADLWAADWIDMSWEHELQRVLTLLDKAPHHNGILLFHDTRPSTARMLPVLLGELRTRHYTIAHLVYKADAPPPALTVPVPGWSSETERIIARLPHPIAPGRHHGAEAIDKPPDAIAPGEGMGEVPP